MKKIPQPIQRGLSQVDGFSDITLNHRHLKLGQLLRAVYTGSHTDETLQILKQIKPKQNEND
jgi:hypothetical protein